MSTRRHMDSDSESDDDQADGARLTLHHGFGARIETIRDAVHFVSDQALLYPVGRYIALHDTQNQLQTLVYEQPAAVQQTTALAISPNLKYLAVCEYVSGEGSALGRSQVTVLFLPTRRLMKILYHTTVEGQIGCATFSHDSKLIACQLGGSESTTTVWHWEKAKLVGSFRSRAPISRIRFNPEQSAVLSLSHPLRILRLNDKGSFKDVELPSMRKLGGVEVQEHLWLSSSRLIVLTADGLAHVFASGEYAYATKWWSPQLNASNLATPPKPSGNLSSDLSAEQSGGGLGTVAEGERGGVGAAPDSTTSGGKPARTLTIPGTDSKMLLANDEFDDLPLTPTSSARMAAAEAERPPCAVTCVRECAQGVLLGTSDGSTLLLAEDPPGSRLQLAAVVRSDTRPHALVSLALSPTEAECLMQFADNQVGTFSLRGLQRSLGIESNSGSPPGRKGAELPTDDAGRKVLEISYELLFKSLHRGPISGLAVSAAKPIFVTCGEDGIVRVYSYISPRVTLLAYTPDDGMPIALAMHPLGVQVALVRKDRVSLLEVGVDALWPSRELHVARATRISYSTGGSYLAVACGSVLQIYSALSGVPIGKMLGHSGTITAMSWAADDMSIASVGSDGLAYRWSVLDGSRLEEHHVKGTPYFSVAIIGRIKRSKDERDDELLEDTTKWRDTSGKRGGVESEKLVVELKSRKSHGVSDRARFAVVAVGSDNRLRLISGGDVSELFVSQVTNVDPGAPAQARPSEQPPLVRMATHDAGTMSKAKGVAGSLKFTSVAALHKCPVVFAGTADGTIHVFSVEMRNRDAQGGVEASERDVRESNKERRDAALAIGGGHGGQVKLSSTLRVIGGIKTGAVAVLVAGSAGARAWQAHQGRVTKIAVTLDDCFLLSAAEDGSVFVFSIALLLNGVDHGIQPVPLASLPLSDVVSLGSDTLAELRAQLAEVRFAVGERRINIEAAVVRAEATWRERLEGKEKAHGVVVAQLERKLTEAQNVRAAETSVFVKRLTAMQQYADNQRRETASHLEGTLKNEIERVTELTTELADERDASSVTVASLQQSLSLEKAAAQKATEALAAELLLLRNTSAVVLELTRSAAEQSYALAEDDNDTEVTNLRNKARDELTVAQSEAASLRIERIIDHNQMAKRQAKIVSLEATLESKLVLLAVAAEGTKALERQLAAMRRAIDERERGLGERDRAYHELSETAVKLVNGRDILDSRVHELEAKERVLQAERRELRVSSDAMMSELKEEARKRELADQALIKTHQSHEAAAPALRAATAKSANFERRLFVIADSLERIVSQSNRSWNDVSALLQAHADKPTPQHPPQFEYAALKETQQHRASAEREAGRLRARLSQSRAERDVALRGQKIDNAELLEDGNALRRENHRLRRALAIAKDMAMQHIANRHDGESAIERSSMRDTLGLDYGTADELGDDPAGSDHDQADSASELELEDFSFRLHSEGTGRVGSARGGRGSGTRDTRLGDSRVLEPRMSEQELELRALREQVSFFLTQPMQSAGSRLPDSIGRTSVTSAPGGSARRGAASGLARGPTTHQQPVNWERAGHTMLRKTVPLPPV